MNVLFVAIRALHIGSAMLLFGELLFALAVAGAAWRKAVEAAPERGGALDARLRRVSVWALAASAASGALWLAIEAAVMAGAPLVQALHRHAIALVLDETAFGHVWLLRGAALVVVAGAALPRWHVRRSARVIALAASGAYLASLAFAGHASAAMQGAWRVFHLTSDGAHALAAGAWLGALPALAWCLRSAQPNAALAGLAQRFSTLGVASVSVLTVTGIVNACILVGSFAALFGTPYGRMLVAKLAVFAVLVAIAGVNRTLLTPRLAGDDGVARRRLQRNVVLEIAGGVLILAIVGALGAAIPAAHESPIWPFAYAVDPSRAELTGAGHATLAGCAAIASIALALIIAGVQRRASRLSIAGSIALALSAGVSTWVLAVPALPTTYAVSPVPYAVDAVAQGAARFAQECAACHGAEGHGDGPAAATLPEKPANLAEHAMHHPQGNLFWWIAHGIPDSPMPAFSPRLSDTQIWELVQFLVARSAADAARSLGPRVAREAHVAVPDFTYEPPGEPQQTLLAPRTPALVVLYSLPQSSARLAELAADHRLAHGALRIIAMPLPPAMPPRDASALVATITSPDVASVYRMFAAESAKPPPIHAELLIDAAGMLRARWIGVPKTGTDQDAAIAAAITALPRAPAAAPAAEHHHGN